MNKRELINYLENRLYVLNKAERDDIINEYIQHIDNKLKEGLTEKEAVETLGNIEDMVSEILSAYNVDPNYDNKGENKINTVVAEFFNKFVYSIKSIGDYILGQRAINLLKLVIKSIVLFFVLWIVFMIGLGICSIFANMVSSVIGAWSFVHFVVNLVYVVVALPTFVYIFVRFLVFSVRGTEMKDIKVNTEPINKKINIKKSFVFEKNNNYSFESIILSIWRAALKAVVIMFKAVVLMCLIPCAISLVFTVMAFGGLVIFAFLGYPLIGATIGCLGFNIAGIALLLIVSKVVFFNKNGVNNNEEVL